MKQGLTLPQLVTELQRQNAVKQDLRADTRAMTITVEDGKPMLAIKDDLYGIKDLAHQQIASGLGIPKRYYDTMLTQAPDLLATNANHWLQNQPQTQTVRLLDGNVRAFLGGTYRCIDHLAVIQGMLPALQDLRADIRFMSLGLTDEKLYLKAVTPRIEAEVAKGDLVQAGIVISNSEVGQGTLTVQPLIYRLVCTNGMISEVGGFKRRHVGRRTQLEEGGVSYASDTLDADDRALTLKARDTVRQVLSEEAFLSQVERLRTATQEGVEAPVKAVEEVTKQFKFNETEMASVLTHFMGGTANGPEGKPDHSRYGLANAITRSAEDMPDYERATKMERAGFELLALPSTDWRAIASAK